MSKELEIIDVAALDTFDNLIDKTNAVILLCNTEIVTVNSIGATTNGIGYVFGTFGSDILVTPELKGGTINTEDVLLITTNTLISDSILYVGNSTVNTTLTSNGITIANSTSNVNINKINLNYGNVSITLNAISVGANISVNTTSISVGNSLLTSNTLKLNSYNISSSFTVNTNGTSLQTIDSFDKSLYRSGQYTISIKDNTTNANSYQISQILIIHSEDSSYLTEYGIITTNNSTGQLCIFSSTTNATHCILKGVPTVGNTIINCYKTLMVV